MGKVEGSLGLGERRLDVWVLRVRRRSVDCDGIPATGVVEDWRSALADEIQARGGGVSSGKVLVRLSERGRSEVGELTTLVGGHLLRTRPSAIPSRRAAGRIHTRKQAQ